jgi:mannose-6-phosphate isomerase-like protein (cupin superfamily)
MSTEYFFAAEGCYIRELSNSADDPAVSIAQARVEPGITTSWHQLKNTIERYVILSGTGLAEIGDAAPRTVNAGDVVHIAAMQRQRITNIGDDDLIFLAICTPRFLPENYQEL